MSTIDYIKSDLYRYHGNLKLTSFLKSFFLNRSFIYSFWFRLSKHNNLLIRNHAKALLKLKSWKYGIQIPPNTIIGYGLYIGHGMSIVINETTIIGNNCNLSQFSTIGSNHGKAAEIGDNVYIGPSVCIVENVSIGHNVTIGAGSIVLKDIPDNATSVGSPSRTVNFNNPGRYITNKWQPQT
ncbi:serine O-acetyltransferase [Pseudomonas psychrophila]|uniref:serine O-acetyltransferase n=1 Tax=Pseudomonas psychrophila TaxID=122355 RepID=UPI000357AB9C|nr:serine O-acetyltransferase [Pseudomonas psychrophila]EPJ96496.1 serine acetyltransferase-related protein [Pseudomonas psychrophila]